MYKRCNCGQPLDIRLRTVIYSKNVEIDHVPIYTCSKCFHTEILTGVKSELARLISELGGHPQKQKIEFRDLNEWAYLIDRAIDQELIHMPIESIIGDRIDQLLDLLLIARSLHDSDWEESLVQRLMQITKPILTV